jgi:SAM-dependent methyltransferase
MHSKAAVNAWEAGCRADAVRNDVVIPHLRRLLATTRPVSVLDLGCGSGYVARRACSRADASSWFLLDRQVACLDYARASWSVAHSRAVRCVEADLTVCPIASRDVSGFDSLPVGGVAFAFAAFTLLEFPLTLEVATNIAGRLMSGGELAVYLPDIEPDLDSARLRCPGVEARYLAGHCHLTKVSKWSGELYPFHAAPLRRLRDVMHLAGLRLVAEERLMRTDRCEEVVCLRFRRAARRGDVS